MFENLGIFFLIIFFLEKNIERVKLRTTNDQVACVNQF